MSHVDNISKDRYDELVNFLKILYKDMYGK